MEAVLFGLVATPIVYGLLRDVAAMVVSAGVLAFLPDLASAGEGAPALDADPYDIAPCFVVSDGSGRPALS